MLFVVVFVLSGTTIYEDDVEEGICKWWCVATKEGLGPGGLRCGCGGGQAWGCGWSGGSWWITRLGWSVGLNVDTRLFGLG